MKRTALARHTPLRARQRLQARSTLRRGAPLARTGPIKAHAPKPKAWVDPGLRAFVRTLPCVVLGCGRRTEPCHVKVKNQGHDRNNLYPGCHSHHAEQHASGIVTFERKYQLDLVGIAYEVTARYDMGGSLAHSGAAF